MASLLESKVVIVTGGGHGIGRAYCLAIAREGGRVAVADIDVAAAERVAREVGEAGGEALPLQTDVANLNSCVDMTQRTVTHFGQIDGLVNNAAIYLTIPAPRGAYDEITEEEWDRTMAVNVKGVWLCSRAVAAAMKERNQGSIVNVSSNAAFNGTAGQLPYTVSKAAVLGISRAMARELGQFNIRVNSICPGLTLSDEDPTEETIRAHEAMSQSSFILKRVAYPDDIVGTALYLLSDLSSIVTGQAILVNAGRLLH